MRLRLGLIVYLGLLHLALAALAVAVAGAARPWLFAVEAGLLVSLAAGVGLVRRVFAAGRFPDEAAHLLEGGDFTSRLLEVGEPSVDRLVRLYNGMADRLRAERVRLQEQHFFLAQLIEASPSGIVTLDYDGLISSANPTACRLLGRPASALAGRRPDQIGGTLAAILAALPPGGTASAALGGGRRARCRRRQFVDLGFPRSFYLIEELTDELRQAERAAYDKVIRMVSHEVNNTVGAAGSLLHSCRRYAPQLHDEDRTDFEAALGVVIGRTEQLNRFVRGFADVVRLPDPRREPCEIGAVVTQVARLLGPECERRRIQWNSRLDSPVVAVVDRAQIEQALLNICRNALEAVEPGGAVTVMVGSLEGRQTLVVEDTGAGIAEEVRDQLFTPFFTTKPHGQGLGLTLVHEILTRHGLAHDLTGPPGGPTRFTIWLDEHPVRTGDGPAAHPTS